MRLPVEDRRGAASAMALCLKTFSRFVYDHEIERLGSGRVQYFVDVRAEALLRELSLASSLKIGQNQVLVRARLLKGCVSGTGLQTYCS